MQNSVFQMVKVSVYYFTLIFWSPMTVILSGTVLLYFILNCSDRCNLQEEIEKFQANINTYNKVSFTFCISVFL